MRLGKKASSDIKDIRRSKQRKDKDEERRVAGGLDPTLTSVDILID